MFDRRTGEIAERSGLIMARLNKNVVLGLIQILEQIEDAPKRIHRSFLPPIARTSSVDGQ
ncbi:hypothetical protein CO667_23835 [Rhizobium sp. L43]|nr:hypothetical protein CO667_23835 [Rhizobium sp. L43]